MSNEHPIKKAPGTVPHDPRNEPLPETGTEKGNRSAEEAEREARKEEGLDMKGLKTSGKKANGPREDNAVTEDEYGMPTGIRTSQTIGRS